MTVAALFVAADGPYPALVGRGRCWTVEEDGRTYGGPLPVVAHPPCERWSRLAGMVEAKHGRRRGDDGGTFAAALAAVERFGGVLEHPAGSAAWKRYNIPTPPAAGGWIPCLFRPGWTCHVEQGHFGHEAPKPTWLYLVARAPSWRPPALPWGPSGAVGRVDAWNSRDARRWHSPAAFARLLVDLAAAAGSVAGVEGLECQAPAQRPTVDGGTPPGAPI